jgi:hypothetical protein
LVACADLHGLHAGLGFHPGLERAVVDDRDIGRGRLVSTTVHFMVVASRITQISAATALPPIADAAKPPIIRT